MNDDKVLVDIIATNLKTAEGGMNSQLMADRAEALRYYYMRPKPDGIISGSQVIAGELSAAVEATLSNIMGAVSSDCLASFKPTGPQDEDQAVLESSIVQNKVLNKGFMTFQTAIKDALTLRNGYVKVWIEEDEIVESKQLYFPTKEDAVMAIAGLEKDSTANEKIEVKPGKDKNTLRLKKTTTVQTPRVAAIPPENICYTTNWETHEFDRVPFIAERHVVPRSDLVKMGLNRKLVNDLKAFHDTTDSLKNTRQRETNFSSNNNDKSLDMIEYYECYVLYDGDNDGIAERHKVLYADEVILEDEEVSPYVPYVTAIALLKQHSAQGMSLFDKLKHIQDINTGLTRGLLNNINVVNRQRIIFSRDRVDGNDITNPDPLACIGVDGNGAVQDAVKSLDTIDMSQGILMNLDYQRKVRDELGGSALQISSGETQTGSALGSQGLDRVYSAREMLVALMTENLVETLIKGTFMLFHKVMKEYWIGELNTNLSGIWKTTTPSDWQSRNEIDVKVGLSVGERQRLVGALTQMINLQMQLAQMGQNDILVSSKTFYNSMIDWCRQNYISSPERFLINPDSQESKAAKQAAQQSAQQSQAEQKGLMAHALKLQELEIAQKKYSDELKISFEKWQTQLQEAVKLQIAEAGMVTGLAGSINKELKDGLDEEAKV